MLPTTSLLLLLNYLRIISLISEIPSEVWSYFRGFIASILPGDGGKTGVVEESHCWIHSYAHVQTFAFLEYRRIAQKHHAANLQREQCKNSVEGCLKNFQKILKTYYQRLKRHNQLKI
jgi:hypothetical protein